MPPWLYFSRPTNLAFHNLCSASTKLPFGTRTLLGLGLNFCPRPSLSTSRTDVDFDRFRRDCYTKLFFAGSPALPPTTLFIRSKWEPPRERIDPEFRSRVADFNRNTAALFRRRKCRPNFIPSQLAAFENLRVRSDLVIFQCDKNLGPAIIERERYIRLALDDHLSDTTTYRRLTAAVAVNRIQAIRRILVNFIERNLEAQNNKRDAKFLRRSLSVKDPFAYFYITAKVHKTPFKTRPIVSVSGSLLHGLGRWVDHYLQQICAGIPYRATSSQTLVDELRALGPLPPSARFFTCDALSMYTNIDTDDALETIDKYLRQTDACRTLDTDCDSIMAALKIIMRHNVFRFGDTYWLQLQGTAMGTPPAPMYATLYFAILEIQFCPSELPLAFYRRYIDDGFGIWNPSTSDTVAAAAEWTSFQLRFNGLCSLRWEFTPQSTSVDFLDLTISLDQHSFTISTRLFEKALNLYLYLPPHSSHPPGVLKGLIFGMIKRIFQLSSDTIQAQSDCRRFLTRLVARGYSPLNVTRIARLAEASLRTRPDPSSRATQSPSLFLHVPFHPSDPRSSLIQQQFRSRMLVPGNRPLSSICNNERKPFKLDRLTIAYSRPRNLGNYFSPRKLHGPGVEASAVIDSDERIDASNPDPNAMSTPTPTSSIRIDRPHRSRRSFPGVPRDPGDPGDPELAPLTLSNTSETLTPPP
jgi:hypothetical protein